MGHEGFEPSANGLRIVPSRELRGRAATITRVFGPSEDSRTREGNDQGNDHGPLSAAIAALASPPRPGDNCPMGDPNDGPVYFALALGAWGIIQALLDILGGGRP